MSFAHRARWGWLRDLMLATSVFVCSEAVSWAALWASPSQSDFAFQPKLERYILTKVNQLRLEKGLGELTLNLRLREAARDHCLDMARLGYFSHEDLEGHRVADRVRKRKILDWHKLGENIAKCDVKSDPARQAMEGWLGSAKHLQSILDKEFAETGVGAVTDSEGNMLFCQVFLAK